MLSKSLVMVLGCGLLASSVAHAAAPAVATSKKFIELGWGIPNTAFLREHAFMAVTCDNGRHGCHGRNDQ